MDLAATVTRDAGPGSDERSSEVDRDRWIELVLARSMAICAAPLLEKSRMCAISAIERGVVGRKDPRDDKTDQNVKFSSVKKLFSKLKVQSSTRAGSRWILHCGESYPDPCSQQGHCARSPRASVRVRTCMPCLCRYRQDSKTGGNRSGSTGFRWNRPGS